MRADVLSRHRGHVLNAIALKKSLESWGYRRGEQDDGGHIHSHCWKADDRHSVWLHHTGTPLWLDASRRAAIRHFQVCRAAEPGGRETPIALAEVPAILMATVLAQSQKLSERGEGSNSDWERIS